MTDKPLDYMVTVDATGLQETAPVRSESDNFEDTPTSLDITRVTPSTPLYARLTLWLEFVSDSTEGAARIALTGPSGKETQYTDPAIIDDGVGIRSTGWVKVPADFNGGTARLQVSNARVTAVTLELAVRNDI